MTASPLVADFERPISLDRPRLDWLAELVAAGAHHLQEKGSNITGQWGNVLWKPDPGTRVVVVGNGPSLLKHRNGTTIDSFDEIIRFNRYCIRGFEPFTGTRTTLWSTFGHDYVPGDDTERPKRMIFVYGERGQPAYEPTEIYRIPKAYYRALQNAVQDASHRPSLERQKLGMSSGCLVIHWLLEVVGLESIHFTGLDHFRKDFSSQHHYYNPRAYAKPPELDGEAEAALLSKYAQSGRLIPI